MFDWLKNLFNLETRSGGGGVTGPFLNHLVNENVAAGVPVNEASALTVPFLFRAIDLIAGKAASLPPSVYLRNPQTGTRTVQPDHPFHYKFHFEPNELYSARDLWKAWYASAVLYQNGYIWIHRNTGNLYILHPVGTILRYMYGSWVYQTTMYQDKYGNVIPAHQAYAPESIAGATSKTFFIPLADVLHLKGLMLGNAMSGVNMVVAQKEAIGEALAQQRYTNAVFTNGYSPQLQVKVPWKFKTPEERDLYRRSMDTKHAGPRAAFKTLIMEQGAEATSIGQSNRDIDLLKLRQFSIKQISAMTGVPMFFLGEEGGASQYKGPEDRSQVLLDYCIDNYLLGAESQFRIKCLSEREKRSGLYDVECDRRKLIQMDVETSRKILWQDFANGIKNRNEVRAALGDGPIPDGDVYFVPSNLVPVEQALAPPPPPPPMPAAEDIGDDTVDGDSQGERTLSEISDKVAKVTEATVHRIMNRIGRSIRSRTKKADFSTWLADEFTGYHRGVILDQLAALTPDADVITDDLLQGLAEELGAVTRDQIDTVLDRWSDTLTKDIHGN
jgi:HK97 family phage portal protein